MDDDRQQAEQQLMEQLESDNGQENRIERTGAFANAFSCSSSVKPSEADEGSDGRSKAEL